jgi:hypothetical protein
MSAASIDGGARAAARRYFAALERHLQLDDADERDLLRELQDHVSDRADAFMRAGLASDAAHRRAIAALGRPEALAHSIRQARYAATWREALFAAVPAELTAVLLATGLWRAAPLALAFALTIAAVTVWGLWRGRPVWFYPWASIAWMLPFIAGYLAFLVISANARDALASPLSLGALVASGAYLPLGLLVAGWALLAALRRDWLDATVLLTPLVPALAWLLHLHGAGAAASVDRMTMTVAFVFAGMGACTVGFLRADSRAARVSTIVASSIALVAATSMAGASVAPAALVARSVLLVAFLLSPALVTLAARRAA